MPPARKFQREDIINTALHIVSKEGIENVNARRIAKELGCSIQPIFHNFATMEELTNAVKEKIYQTYRSYMTLKGDEEKPYKAIGMSYIRFAMDFPEFFKILFMQKTELDVENYLKIDDLGIEILKAGQKMTGLSEEEQSDFHTKVWIFTHGIACLVATETAKFSDAKISELLQESVFEMLLGYRQRKEGIGVENE